MEGAILRRVEEQAGEWFPELGPPREVRLDQLVNRPRAVLYGVHVNGSSTPQVLAKVRPEASGGEVGGWAGARPRLATTSVSASELVALEYAGLCAIDAMLEPTDPDFAAVRPLAHLEGEDTILMDYVNGQTLRQVLLGQSRLPFHRSAPQHGSETMWRRAGTWLRTYQHALPVARLPARQAGREDVVERFLAYDEFLVDRLGRRAFGDAALRGADLAAQLLPDRLSMAVGHGDFAPRNVFVLRDGRLAVFDPLPRWAVPRFEDLSRFLVACRLMGVQLLTRGAAFSETAMNRREQDLIEGYRGEADLALPELRCHQLLITLDLWSALVDIPAEGLRGRLREAAVTAMSGYLRRETERVADLIEAERGRTRPA